jgi:IS30 family transposase
MKYKHLSIEERELIQLRLWEKKSLRAIAGELSRPPSTVSREINRNLPAIHYRYAPRLAHFRALANRKNRGRQDRLKNERVREYVISHLKKRWSPEQIANTIKVQINETISHEAIYQYVYAQIHRQGYGWIKPGCLDLRTYLRRRKKRRTRKGARRCQRCFKPKGASINERPKEVNQRIRIGDWESDTVESINHRPGINTLAERKSGLVLITKLAAKTGEATADAIISRLNKLPRTARQTITSDNGPENSNWQTIEKQINVKTFFANPYHFWERGTNENANGLIRDYFPKKTDFTVVSEEEIRYVENELNNRPRKRLNWKTPLKVFSVALEG